MALLGMAGVAAANAPPMAEAGLDQEATINTTVYLDAGGSVDPDGDVVSHHWSIERPNGSTMEPDCASCVLTHFVPHQLGQYNVTVTVRDDDGAMQSDTMYVEVGGVVVDPDSSQSMMSNQGGGWGGGGNADSVMFNHESGHLWISLDGNGVQLSGANRNPAETGAAFNKWMTEEEIAKLAKSNVAVIHDDRLEVTGEQALDLRSTLNGSNTLEYQHPNAESFSASDRTAEMVLEDPNKQTGNKKVSSNEDTGGVNRGRSYSRSESEDSTIINPE
ncbi:MAG: PKD domain-containing protein, partial [Salinirussus sp.]